MKRVISLIIALALVFLISSSAFAADNDYFPIINVTGFGRTNLVKDKGTPDEKVAFPPSGDAINAMVKELALPAVGFLLGENRFFAKSLVKSVNSLFEDITFDDNGNPKYNNISLQKESGYSNGMYYFRYDWRFDVMDIANNLNAYIEFVKAQTGAQKVALLPESMGGAVVMAYIYLYGYDSISAVVMRSSALYGLTMMGEAFTGNLRLNERAVTGFVNGFIQGAEPRQIVLRDFIRVFGSLLLKPLVWRINNFLEKESDYIYSESLSDTLGNIPGLWSFVPDEYYEQAKETMLDENENKNLIEKIDVYHYNVRPQIDSTLTEMKADGVTVAFISNYGFWPFPATQAQGYMTDFLIDTRYTSAGATCSAVDSDLGAGYTQAVDDSHNHISCDNQIDASTCLFPENTWFVKGMVHTWYNTDYYLLVYWILEEGENADVFSNPNYPQFLCNNVYVGSLEPLTTDNMNPMNDKADLPTVFAAIAALIK